MTEQTYFDILCISKDASQEEINDAYIKLVKQSKINKNINLYLVNEAYNVLKNPLHRYNYIRSLEILEMKNNNLNEIQINHKNDISNNDMLINKILKNNPNLSKEDVMKYMIQDSNGNFIFKPSQDDFNKLIHEEDNKTPITSTDISQLINLRHNELNEIKQDIINNHNLPVDSSNNINISIDEFNRMFEKYKQENMQFMNNDDEDDDTFEENNTNCSLLKNLEELKNNDRFNDIKAQIDHARDTKNIDEYIKLREEEMKVITNF